MCPCAHQIEASHRMGRSQQHAMQAMLGVVVPAEQQARVKATTAALNAAQPRPSELGGAAAVSLRLSPLLL
eukprot:1581078-Pleurochrysis_carterae.AAC.1